MNNAASHFHFMFFPKFVPEFIHSQAHTLAHWLLNRNNQRRKLTSGVTIFGASHFARHTQFYMPQLLKCPSFFFQALIEVFQHFNGLFEILIGFFEFAVFFPEVDFFAG